MKQTNNAIKFLLAQYRAIYKHAYAKGVFTGLIVSAGLGIASSANAAAITDGAADWENIGNTTVTVESKDGTLPTNSFYNSMLIKGGANLTVSTTRIDNKLYIKDTITVENNGTLNLTVTDTNPVAVLVGWNKLSGQEEATPNSSNASGKLVSSGKINLTGDKNKNNKYYSAQIQMNQITLKSGSETNIISNVAPENWDSYSMVVAGFGDNGKFDIESGATVNMDNYSQLVVTNGATMNINGTINMKGSSAFIRGDDGYTYNDSTGTFATGAKNSIIKLDQTGKIVVGNKDGKKTSAYIVAPKTDILGSIQVLSGASLELNGDFASGGVVITEAKPAAGQFTMHDSGKLDIASGGKLVIGNGKYEANKTQLANETSLINTLNVSGGTFTNAGTVEVQGKLIFGAKSTLTNTGKIKVNKDGNLNFDVESLKPVENTARDVTYYTADLTSQFSNDKIANSGTLTLSSNANATGNIDEVEKYVSIFKVDKLTTLTGTSATKGKVVLDNDVILNVAEDLTLSNANFGADAGKISATDSGGNLFSQNVTFNVPSSTSSPNTVNLQGVHVNADNLTFKGTVADSKLSISSDSAQSFTVNKYLTASGTDSSADTLVLAGNINLNLSNIDLENSLETSSVEGKVDVNLDVQGSSTLEIGHNGWTLKNIDTANGLTVNADVNETTGEIQDQYAYVKMDNLTVTGSNVDISNQKSFTAKAIKVNNSNANTFELNNILAFKADSFTTEQAANTFKATDAELDIKNISSSGSFTLTDSSLKSESIKTAAFSLTNGSLDTKSINTTGQFTTNNTTINISGDGDKTKVDFNLASSEIKNSTINLNDVSDTLGWTSTNNELVFGSFEKVNADNSTFNISLAGTGITSLSIEKANGLVTNLANGSGNLVHLAEKDLVAIPVSKNPETGRQETSFDAISSGGSLNMTFDTDTTREATLTGVKGSITGGWGAVELAPGSSNASVGAGQLAIYNNAGGDSKNLVQTADGKVAGVVLSNSKSVLNIKSQGNIGAITGGSGTVTLNANSSVNVINTEGTKANVNVGNLNGTGSLVANEIKSKDISLSSGAKIVAEKLEVDGGSFAVENTQIATTNIDLTKVKDTANISGGVVSATESIKAKDLALSNNAQVSVTSGTISATNLNVEGNAVVQAKKIELASQGRLAVGTEGENSSSGRVVAETIDLKNGRLVIDPEYGNATATVFAKNIGTANGKTMKLSGDIVVGRNSALGIGGTEKDFTDALAQHQNNGQLSADSYGAIVFVNRSGIDLNGKKLIIGTEDITELENKLDQRTSNADIILSQGSAIEVGALALNDARKNQNHVFVADANSPKTIESKKETAGTLIVPAFVDQEDLALIFSEQYSLASTDGTTVLNVKTADGLFGGQITTNDLLHGKGLELGIQGDARTVMYAVSDPMIEYFENINSNETARYNTEADFDALENPYGTNGVAIIKDEAGFSFLSEAYTQNGGIAVERAARLGTFAGAIQAANLASRTTSDAISGRFGMASSESKLSMASNTQGAALWVTPIYKSQDSDSLGAQGLSYGADVNLYGAALGFDYTLNGGIRVGGMFNVGSGDSDGQGAGAGVKSDFDYYGFGIYAGFTPMKNLSLSADVSYTVVDNDLEADSQLANWGKLKSSTDTTALSIGATAQYTFNTASLDVAPHIGLRFTRLDMDTYIVKSVHGEISETSTDAMNVFSIPVGVSISKDIVAGSWTIRPALDLSVSMNAGDDDVKTHTEFGGVVGTGADLNAEVMDSFTYGADLGLSGTNGSFSFGINAGYVGGSDTSEYGVSANARLMF